MARYAIQFQATDQQGAIVVGATVRVSKTGTDDGVSIYSALSGGSALTDSSTTTDSEGRIKVFVDEADYSYTQHFRVTVSGNRFVTFVLDDIVALPFATIGHANNELDNLTNVAINMSLVSDTHDTDDLGTEAIAWKKAYLGSGGISFEGTTDNAFQTTLNVTDPTADNAITIPDATDTVVGRATTDTLTNKTINTASNTITILQADISDLSIEGTDIKSTGEGGGTKYLREDGDNTCSWQTISGGGGGVKNLIINGGFQVNQRVYVSSTNTANLAYMHDRWRSSATDSDYAFSTASPASPQTITIAANAGIEQVVEGANISTAGTHTISWTGTATARAVVNTQTTSGNFAVSPIQVTAVLDQIITIEFTGADAVGGSTLATNTGTLGKVQLELGSTASDFEIRDYATELAMCQRYYELLGSQCNGEFISTTIARMGCTFATVKRAAPTIEDLATGSNQIRDIGVGTVTATAAILLASSSSTAGAILNVTVSGATSGNTAIGMGEAIAAASSEL